MMLLMLLFDDLIVVVVMEYARFVIVFVHQMIICVITCSDLMSIGWQDGSGCGGDSSDQSFAPRGRHSGK